MGQTLDFTNVSAAAETDIRELQHKILAVGKGELDEERFKHYRLTRGVYGQRQLGVQMFRIKIPFGRLTAEQLIRIADISEKYTNGNLHLTTRQNIQLHYVKLADSPAIWTELAEKNITAREACGNTVRNLTGSARAGIDPDELFDVSPYVQAAFEYFLRNPISQDMGRKIKPAFSSSDKDSAFTYFHDFGFIPRIQVVDGIEKRGFKVVVGGGLGAQSMVAQTAYEFLAEDKVIPFMEAAIRVFDRYGERKNRMKARLKFLLKQLGFQEFMRLVEAEKLAVKNKTVAIDRDAIPSAIPPKKQDVPNNEPVDKDKYNLWLITNVFQQKQADWYGVQLRVQLGDVHAETARKLADLVKKYAADDIRLTVNQGILIKFIRKDYLPYLYNELNKLGLAEPGFDTLADITSCPGTDTCALGVTNSTGLTKKLEEVIIAEYPALIQESDIRIKISGCMNSCGQHMAAQIGFHGSSIKKAPLVLPAMQIVMGGGVDVNGKGFVAEKVIKIPTRRVPDALRTILADYEEQGEQGEYFNDYYYRLGKRYFYSLLKPLADLTSGTDDLVFDWGQDEKYVQEIGVGECAGVAFDMIGAIINDSRERSEWAAIALADGRWSDALYHAYSSQVIGAKALLLAKDVKCNTHKSILSDFEKSYTEAGDFPTIDSLSTQVLAINKEEPSEKFANEYVAKAADFFQKVLAKRKEQLADAKSDKLVVGQYYNA